MSLFVLVIAFTFAIMNVIAQYTEYFKNLADRNNTLHADGFVFSSDADLASIYEGTMRSNLPQLGSWLFLLINPVVNPKSFGNTIDAQIQGGFVLLKSVGIRDISENEIESKYNDSFNLSGAFIAKMVLDSRNNNSFLNNSFNDINNSNCDLEKMPLLKTQDASFLGWKVIFTLRTEFLLCNDISSADANFSISI